MERYGKYRDSGIDWLGEIPENWKAKKIKYIADLRSGSNLTSNEIKDNGKYPVYGGNGLRGYYQEFSHEGNFILIGRQGALCGNINYAKGKFWATDHAIVTEPIEKYELIWFGELLRTMNLNQYSVAAAQPGLAVEAIKNLFVPYSPLKEQKAIARYLDRKTAEIDKLIAQKERLIELYEEEKTAIINQAVTKGINPDVKLKSSGIDWLGDIPEHWKPIKIRYYSEFVTSGSRGWSQYFSDSGSIFLRITNVSGEGIELNLQDIKRVLLPSNIEGERAKVLSGDVIISITADLGSVVIVPDNFEQAYVSQHLALVRPIHSKIYSQWIAYQVCSSTGKKQLLSSGYGGTKIQLSLTDIRDLWITLPPLEEQKAIADYIKTECDRIDNKIAKTKRIIELQKEYRTALISEAVTGKIKVPQLD